MAGGSEGKDKPGLRSGGDGGQRSGVRAEDVVRDVYASIEDAAIDAKVGAINKSALEDMVRWSVRQVREDRQVAYANLVSKNAAAYLKRAEKRLAAYMAAHGYTEKVWHGTEGDDFNVFRFSSGSHGVSAAYLAYRRETAENYAALRSMDAEDLDNAKPNVRAFYVNPGRVLDIDEDSPGRATNFEEFVERCKKAYADGYDAMRIKNAYDDQGFRFKGDETMENMEGPSEAHDVRTDILIVFDRDGNPGANRIKAADPVTFMDDVDGELPIPLEMRADQSVPDVRYSVAMGRRAKEEARRMIEKYRPGIHGFVTNVNGTLMPQDDAAIDAIAAFGTPKERKAALYWFCKDTIRLPEDAPKVVEALKTAEKAKIDPFQFERPGDILDQFAEYRPTEPAIDPETVPELSDRREMGNGIVTYLVQDDKAGQAAMRRIVNTHFGKDANPWCLLQGDGYGNLAPDAWDYWRQYNALPKRVAFQNGKLVAFMATDRMTHTQSAIDALREDLGYEPTDDDILDALGTGEQWWDRTDTPHDGVPFTRTAAAKDGGADVTEWCELGPDGAVAVTKTTRGNPKADGVHEEWNAAGDYVRIVRENGRNTEYSRTDRNGVERTTILNGYIDNYRVRLEIGRDGTGEVCRIRFDDEYNGRTISQDFAGSYITYDPRSGSDEYKGNLIDDETARHLYEATLTRDKAEIDRVLGEIRDKVAPKPAVDAAASPTMVGAESQAERKSARNSVFAGERIASPKNLKRLDDAKRMLDEAGGEYGAITRYKIYDETGWWKGVDGKWRIELPKLKAKNIKNVKSVEFADSWRFCERWSIDEYLAFHLGDLVTIPAEMAKCDREELGEKTVFMFHDADFNRIFGKDTKAATELRFFPGPFGDTEAHIDICIRTPDVREKDGREYLPDESIGSLTHELQHVIQLEEGFAFGGNFQEGNSLGEYAVAAGEVEARNAERRRDNETRLLPPWATEDFPYERQRVGYSGWLHTDDGWIPMADGTELSPSKTAAEGSGRLAGEVPHATDGAMRHSVRYLGGSDLTVEDNARYFKKYITSINPAPEPERIEDGSPKSALEWFLANMVGKTYSFDIPGIGKRVFTPKAGHIGKLVCSGKGKGIIRKPYDGQWIDAVLRGDISGSDVNGWDYDRAKSLPLVDDMLTSFDALIYDESRDTPSVVFMKRYVRKDGKTNTIVMRVVSDGTTIGPISAHVKDVTLSWLMDKKRLVVNNDGQLYGMGKDNSASDAHLPSADAENQSAGSDNSIAYPVSDVNGTTDGINAELETTNKRRSVRALDTEADARRVVTAYARAEGNKAANDALENYVAYLKLSHGSTPRASTLVTIGLSIGMDVVDPKRILINGGRIAEQMRGTLVEQAAKNGDVATVMALIAREKDVAKRLDDLIAGGVFA